MTGFKNPFKRLWMRCRLLTTPLRLSKQDPYDSLRPLHDINTFFAVFLHFLTTPLRLSKQAPYDSLRPLHDIDNFLIRFPVFD